MTFAEKVYEAVSRIPKGRVATYGQIAEIIGCPGGSRAVGNALHVNPFAPVGPAESAEPVQSANSDPDVQTRRIVPCHRVVAADGSLAAHFGGGGPSVQYSRLAPEGVVFLPEPDLRSATKAASVATVANAALDLAPRHHSGIDPYTPSAPIPRVDLSRSGIVIERHPLEPFLPAGARILFLGSFPPPRARWSMDFFYPNWINDFWRIQGLIHFSDPHYFEYKSLSEEPSAAPELAVPELATSELATSEPSSTRRAASRRVVATCSSTTAEPASASRRTTAPKRFDRARIIDFCTSHGLAFYDTASKVCRWKGNASDEFLEILQPADIVGMLTQMPDCHTVVSTGGKSADELAAILSASGAIPLAGAIPVSGVPAFGTSPSARATALTSDTFIPLRSSSDSAPAITPPPVGSYLDLTLAGRPLRWWRMPSTSRAYPMPLVDKAAQYSLLFQ